MRIPSVIKVPMLVLGGLVVSISLLAGSAVAVILIVYLISLLGP